MSWPQLQQQYLQNLEMVGRSPESLRAATRCLSVFQTFCQERWQISKVEDVDKPHADAFEQRMLSEPASHGRHYSLHTVQESVIILRSFFRWTWQQGYISHNPFAHLVAHQAPFSSRLLTVDEMTKLLKTPTDASHFGLRDRALMATLYYAGLDPGECMRLNLPDLDLQKRVILLRFPNRPSPFRGGAFSAPPPTPTRYIPMAEPLHEYLAAYLARGRAGFSRSPDEPAVFLGEWGKRLVRPGKIILKHALAAQLGRITARLLRMAFARHLVESQRDRSEVQRLLGFRSLDRLRIYARRLKKEGQI